MTVGEREVHYDETTGLKTVIQYVEGELGDVYKETQLIRVDKVRVNPRVAERRKLKKFGAAANDLPGPNSANTYPGDKIKIQIVYQNLAQQIEKEEEQTKKQAPQVTCRHCEGAHLAYKCPNRAEMEAIQELQRLAGKQVGDEEPVQTTSTSGAYVPPNLRGMASSGHSNVMTDRRRIEGHTIRVTNLPEEIEDEWLRTKFTQFGRVLRVFPAKDKATGMNRGFAFITYLRKEDAVTAIEKINTVRSGHLVLGASWAKPSN